MFKLSQNNKIAVSALAVFIVSFTSMVMFLDENVDLDETHANVLHVAKDPNNFASFDDGEAPMFITNVEGEVLYKSADFCALLQKSCKKSDDENVFDYVKESDHADLAPIYAKLVQSGKEIGAIGPLVMLSGGSEKLVLLDAKPIFDRKENVEFVVFSAKDLTEKAKDLEVK